MVTLCRAALAFDLRVILDSDILLSSHQCCAEKSPSCIALDVGLRSQRVREVRAMTASVAESALVI
jgi:hypothetical protein